SCSVSCMDSTRGDLVSTTIPRTTAANADTVTTAGSAGCSCNTATPMPAQATGSAAVSTGSEAASGPAWNALLFSTMPQAASTASAYGSQDVAAAPIPS